MLVKGAMDGNTLPCKREKTNLGIRIRGKKIIRFLVNWGGPGGEALVSADAILDLLSSKTKYWR